MLSVVPNVNKYIFWDAGDREAMPFEIGIYQTVVATQGEKTDST